MTWNRIIGFIATLVLAVLFFVPFYFVFVNSVKSFDEIMMNSAALPRQIVWSNFSQAWHVLRFNQVFINSLVVTVFSIIGIVIMGSMAAYRLARAKTVVNRVLFYLLISQMVIPFQSIMIPLVQFAKKLGLINHLFGLVVCYYGFGLAFAVFLFHGFIKGIPKEIEEAAIIDGCSPYGVFWRIVFPLLRPIMISVIMIDTLWIWNDFLLPLLILQKPEVHTIPLAVMSLFSEYLKQWDLALAALVLCILPMFVFFKFLQKHILEGITAGSVKG
ncbi:raffinose/stachyose/melibiose transport system permease protein [Melghirimyces profundicolus]|uniref:Raffinose/stachyose/melibiose transport system permease protein n=1 Tax=Melghirimyces profundicolus TaxID=1242148 RepID=A0A2T6ATG3_9BACL|nr:carbohydrate ABC transporter permease [Melghirimyces profundicolus]PTX47114.1 raffinose/stachyose/melibiose transport system permease protein [Melghirimyces profundicolus]